MYIQVIIIPPPAVGIKMPELQLTVLYCCFVRCYSTILLFCTLLIADIAWFRIGLSRLSVYDGVIFCRGPSSHTAAAIGAQELVPAVIEFTDRSLAPSGIEGWANLMVNHVIKRNNHILGTRHSAQCYRRIGVSNDQDDVACGPH